MALLQYATHIYEEKGANERSVARGMKRIE